MKKPFAVWLTGLPGSGKSTVAKELVKKLRGKKIQILRMDEFRKFLFPKPMYSEEERNIAYKAMVLIGYYLVENNINVIFDATGNKRAYRNFARGLIKNFYEVYVKCNLKEAMKRESLRKQNLIVKNLYKKALQRLALTSISNEVRKPREGISRSARDKGKKVKLVGQVIGIDVPYEKPLKPNVVIDTENTSPKKAAEKIAKVVK